VIPAHAEQRCQPVALAELEDPFAPLRGAGEVTDALTAEDHPAARAGDHLGVAHLARGRRRGRLVEQAHPLGDKTGGNTGDPVRCPRVHLQVEHPQAAGDLDGVVRPAASLLHVAGEHEGEQCVVHRQQRVLR
jgi:hypothetical protein